MVKSFLRNNPAFFLLLLVYFIIIPNSISYENAWMQPEQLYIKTGVLKTGTSLSPQDFKNGMFWQLFEYEPRCTRILSSFFEILDTKFRVWLWNFIPPHPSLSLTWIFSLFLTPLILFLLIRSMGASLNTALTMTAFYLSTPGALSCVTMLFRPAKPMTNFFLIFCLYLAFKLKNKFLNNEKPIPIKNYLFFWITVCVSFFWDETMLLFFIAIFFFVPEIFKSKKFLLLWFLLPIITYISYFYIIPYISYLSGHSFPQLVKYDKLQFVTQWSFFHESFKYLAINTKNLFLDTMGIWTYSAYSIKNFSAISIMPWLIIGFYILVKKPKFHPSIIFLIFLIFYFNYTMTICRMLTWGPYYYGIYWSIFFIICLSFYIERSKIPKTLLTICFFFIILNTSFVFLSTNTIYKKYHYYPYNPGEIELYYQGKKDRFSPQENPFLPGEKIHSEINKYWTISRKSETIDFTLPRELCWLPLELRPNDPHTRFTLLKTDNVNYLNSK